MPPRHTAKSPQRRRARTGDIRARTPSKAQLEKIEEQPKVDGGISVETYHMAMVILATFSLFTLIVTSDNTPAAPPPPPPATQLSSFFAALIKKASHFMH
jgi:hypothetical protein